MNLTGFDDLRGLRRFWEVRGDEAGSAGSWGIRRDRNWMSGYSVPTLLSQMLWGKRRSRRPQSHFLVLRGWCSTARKSSLLLEECTQVHHQVLWFHPGEDRERRELHGIGWLSGRKGTLMMKESPGKGTLWWRKSRGRFSISELKRKCTLHLRQA